MIEVRDLTKNYADHCALSGLSFTAPDGGVLGFIGPNGAGKSTAMRIICGVSLPSAGSVMISGKDMIADPFSAKQMLGYLPENAPLHAGMSVKAFLSYCGKMRNLSGKALALAVDSCVEKCALEDVLLQDTETLSKGYRRRVCLAQAIMHDPPNLVLDEPTDGLDPDQKRDIRSLIRRIRDFTTVIVSTHILEELDAVCSSVLAIRSGKKVFHGSIESFRALSPDDGALLLDFIQAEEKDLAFLEKIPGVLKMCLEKRNERIRVRLLQNRTLPPMDQESVFAEIFERKLKLTGSEKLQGKLEDVFSAVGSGEKRE